MSFLEKLEQHKTLIFIFLLLVIGVSLRLAFIDKTDMYNDETFHIKLAYKFATVIWAYPIPVILGLVIAAGFVYFIAYRRNLHAAGIACGAILLARFVIGVPVISKYTDVGYFYQIINSLLIVATNMPPQIVGELLMSGMLTILAVAGYFIGKELWNKKAGLLLCSFLMLSPLSIFISGTVISSGLSDSLMYLSLGLLLVAFKKPKLAPVAGIFGALAIATRHPPALLVLIAPIAMYLNREVVLKKENRKEFIIFSMLVAASFLIYLPDMIDSYLIYAAQEGSGPMFGYGSFPEFLPHYSVEVADIFAGVPSILTYFLYIPALSYFYSPLLLLLMLGAMIWVVKKKDKNLYVFLLTFLLFFAFFTLKPMQRPHHMLTWEFSMFAIVVVFLTELKFNKIRNLLISLLIAYFLLQSIHIVSYHNFRGISEFSAKLPDGSTIFTNDYGVAYYSGAYKTDKTIRNPFLSRLLPTSATEEKPRVNIISADFYNLGDLNSEEVDYLLIERSYLEGSGTVGLENFEFCYTINNKDKEIAWVYSSGGCDAIN